jgi:hypothetical protein
MYPGGGAVAIIQAALPRSSSEIGDPDEDGLSKVDEKDDRKCVLHSDGVYCLVSLEMIT